MILSFRLHVLQPVPVCSCTESGSPLELVKDGGSRWSELETVIQVAERAGAAWKLGCWRGSVT